MTCKPFRQSVFLHAHGELGRAQSWVVERHLAVCPACREEWQRTSREASELRDLLAPHALAVKSVRLTPAQLLAERSERLVNGGRTADAGAAYSWLPAGWAQHFGRPFEAGAGRGAGRWPALLVVAALLAGGLAAAAALGPPSDFVQRCLGLSPGSNCPPTMSDMPPPALGDGAAGPAVSPTITAPGSSAPIPPRPANAPSCAVPSPVPPVSTPHESKTR